MGILFLRLISGLKAMYLQVQTLRNVHLLSYKAGLDSLSYYEEKLATPDTKFIDLTAVDVNGYKIP
jgi:hypothetical protein